MTKCRSSMRENEIFSVSPGNLNTILYFHVYILFLICRTIFHIADVVLYDKKTVKDIITLLMNLILASTEPRSPRPPEVRYRVGQVIRHKIWGYRGVIVAWDPQARVRGS